MSKSIAKIGGSPAGLAAARLFLSNAPDFKIDPFEGYYDID